MNASNLQQPRATIRLAGTISAQGEIVSREGGKMTVRTGKDTFATGRPVSEEPDAPGF